METNALVKRIVGNEYKVRSATKFWVWLDEQSQNFRESIKIPFEGIVLRDDSQEDLCDHTGLAWATLRGRLYTAYDILRSAAKSMPRRRFNSIFVSVYDHEFSTFVRTRELTECLFGFYDRRATQVITVKWIPKVQSGVWNLPMPTKKGSHWEWTREQAQIWRVWFVSEYGENHV